MAVSLPGGSLDGRRRARRRRRPLSEINVTPFVDVMLVLLIIFMVAAPLLSTGVPLDLPQTQATRLTGDDEPLVVSIDAGGELYLQNRPISPEELIERLRAITATRPDSRVFMRADQSLSYGTVMQVMGQINMAGVGRLSLMSALPEGRP